MLFFSDGQIIKTLQRFARYDKIFCNAFLKGREADVRTFQVE